MTKYLKVYAICLFVNKIHGLHSYKSIVNADGRPILRTGVDDSGSSYEAESVPEDKPSWLVGLRARIEKLVSRYGYEAAKSHIQKTVEDTEKKESVLLDVKVERNGESAIMYEYNRQKKPLRSFDEDDISKTTEGNVDVEIKQLESKSRKPARKPHSSNTGSHKLRDYTIMSE
ncbi:uncharacterized protein isoform X2 [Choristoneura fumiferana]|uniref:uncharacterized protein isoform X2 n=1 Tax=Choristoneura fumiferana TaxID=7141 RepID=UPI003D155F49